MSQIFIWNTILDRGPLLPVQNNYERFFNSAPQDVASELGLVCFTGRPNLLLIDFDHPADDSRNERDLKLNILSQKIAQVKDYFFTRSKSGNLHAYVRLANNVTFASYMNALSMCGSDMMRNDIVRKKVKMNPNIDPFSHVALFETPEEARLVREFLGQNNDDTILW